MFVCSVLDWCYVDCYEYTHFGETKKYGNTHFYNEICYTDGVVIREGTENIFLGRIIMKKRKLFVLFITILVCFEGCKFSSDNTSGNVTENKSVNITTEEKDNRYSIENRKISVKDFLLEMPQIKYSSDKNKQNYLNKLIIDNVERYFDNIGLSIEGRIDNFEYSIETESKTKLSILFTYDYYNGEAAHPLISAFAVNLDLETEKIISLDAYKEKIKLFEQNAFSHVTKRKTSLKNDGGVLKDKSIDELLADMDNNSFYFINDKIGIIFEVPYACGGYSIYEEKK